MKKQKSIFSNIIYFIYKLWEDKASKILNVVLMKMFQIHKVKNNLNIEKLSQVGGKSIKEWNKSANKSIVSRESFIDFVNVDCQEDIDSFHCQRCVILKKKMLMKRNKQVCRCQFQICLCSHFYHCYSLVIYISAT